MMISRIFVSLVSSLGVYGILYYCFLKKKVSDAPTEKEKKKYLWINILILVGVLLLPIFVMYLSSSPIDSMVGSSPDYIPFNSTPAGGARSFGKISRVTISSEKPIIIPTELSAALTKPRRAFVGKYY